MKRSIFTREKRSPTSIALSIAIHVLVIADIASITFSVPIAELLTGRDRPPRPATERLTFVRLTPQAQGGGGGVSEAPVAPPGTGERIRAPVS